MKMGFLSKWIAVISLIIISNMMGVYGQIEHSPTVSNNDLPTKITDTPFPMPGEQDSSKPNPTDNETHPPDYWRISPPVFTAGPAHTFDETAVKDPSIVYYKNQWHLFYTARGQEKYQISYAAAPTLAKLNSAPRTLLSQLRGNSDSYAAAPQVFYFTPQNTWYLIYQTRDSNYQPVYSTTQTIENPASWATPKPLVSKKDTGKWIDFWVICDNTTAYLFYTRNQNDVYIQTTSLEKFPDGFGNPKKEYSNLEEAVHVYKAKSKNEYHMIYELNVNQERSFGLATASSLAGPWKKVTDQYATGSQLRYPPDTDIWTEMVSHGEALRSGYDQRLEYDDRHPRWLIQGLFKNQNTGNYAERPWKLGIIEK